jgi:hypothetical protein
LEIQGYVPHFFFFHCDKHLEKQFKGRKVYFDTVSKSFSHGQLAPLFLGCGGTKGGREIERDR